MIVTPEHVAPQIADTGRRDAGAVRYLEVDRRPARREIDDAITAARDAGLWRFDERRPCARLG